ncbi:hypothetical protein Tco_0098852 [Tanacetum coccineum]
MPKESRLLKMFDTMGVEINGLQTRIDKTLLEDKERRWILKEIKEELIKEVQEMLNIFKSMEKQVAEKPPKETILENEIDRVLEVSLTSVKSSNSDRRPKSKDTKSKNIVLKNTKSSSTYVWKTSGSAYIDSNKCEPKDSNVCQTNACVSNSKTVNAYVNVVNDNVTGVNDGLNILVLRIVDSGCSKHMTGNLQLLRNFVEKFMGTVRFENDHFTGITGYGDYV